MARLPYTDRREAGRVLAEQLVHHRGQRAIVLGLPRGGVEVAAEVATALDAPLDVYVVRKLGAPSQPELAIGAIASGGVRVLNDDLITALSIDEKTLEAVTAHEQEELTRRERLYRGERPPLGPEVADKVIIIVDDGLATGATMRAAIRAIKHLGPAKVVCAVPVAAPDVRDAMTEEVDEMICPVTPVPFFGVGRWYERFDPTSDEKVRELLQEQQA